MGFMMEGVLWSLLFFYCLFLFFLKSIVFLRVCVSFIFPFLSLSLFFFFFFPRMIM